MFQSHVFAKVIKIAIKILEFEGKSWNFAIPIVPDV